MTYCWFYVHAIDSIGKYPSDFSQKHTHTVAHADTHACTTQSASPIVFPCQWMEISQGSFTVYNSIICCYPHSICDLNTIRKQNWLRCLCARLPQNNINSPPLHAWEWRVSHTICSRFFFFSILSRKWSYYQMNMYNDNLLQFFLLEIRIISRSSLSQNIMPIENEKKESTQNSWLNRREREKNVCFVFFHCCIRKRLMILQRDLVAIWQAKWIYTCHLVKRVRAQWIAYLCLKRPAFVILFIVVAVVLGYDRMLKS